MDLFCTMGMAYYSSASSRNPDDDSYDMDIRQLESRYGLEDNLNEKPANDVKSRKYQSIKDNSVVHILFVKSKGVDTSKFKAVEAELRKEKNTPTSYCDKYGFCTNLTSIQYIPTYLNQEAKKYNSTINMKLIVHPETLEIDKIDIVGDQIKNYSKNPSGPQSLAKQFEGLLDKYKLSYMKKSNGVIFIYLDTYVPPKKDDTTYYNNYTFRPFAYPALKRAFVNITDTDIYYTSEFTGTITHELLHLYDASDKYKEVIAGCEKNGLGDPDKKPLYPQDKTDIMCGYVMEYEYLSTLNYVDFRMGDMVINKHTAKEIGL